MILVVCPNPSVDTFLHMESFQVKTASRVGKIEKFPGGKGVHVAMAISEMGHEIKLLGFWGGNSGKWLKKKCESKGVDCKGPELNEDNRSCYTLVTQDENNDTEILEPGPTISIENYKQFLNEFDAYIENAHVIIMSGSWPKNVPENAYATLVRKSNEKNIPHILDVTGIQLINALKENPFGLHLNRKETYESFNEEDLNSVLEKTKENIRLMAVTDGSKGLFLRFDNKQYHANIKLNEIYSTVGSGDCLTAGLGIALYKQYTIKEMTAMATACGAANCLRKDLGMLYKSDVMMLLPNIEVNER